MAIVKNMVRFGVVGTLVGGGLIVAAEVARPGSASAIADEGMDRVGSMIDRQIDDPIALRRQLKSLEEKYPAKIDEVRGDLLEVQEQIAQVQRKLDESRMVVQLTEADLGRLEQGIAQGREVSGENPSAIVRITFNRRSVDLSEAYTEHDRIRKTRDTHQTLAEDMQRDLGYLVEQEQQLAGVLQRLETERAEFRGKIYALDAQIDAIARNDRLIKTMEERAQTIERHSRYEAASLDQLEQRIAAMRSEQQARLDAITGSAEERDYTAEASFLVDQARRDAGENSEELVIRRRPGSSSHEVRIDADRATEPAAPKAPTTD